MIEQPKKERRFLKTLGRVGEILIQEVLIKIGSNLIKKIGGKKTLPSILFLFASLSLFAQYPATGNKQRLGYQTTGDGLLFRGRASDTTALKPSTINNAYFVLDTVNNVLYNYIKTKGGWQFSNGDTIIINNNFTQPFDSLFFKTSVPTNNVDTAKMRWDSDLGTVVLGMYDKVPNELGFKNFWLVKNQTGSTITKGSIVYANGTVGASGRITIAKFIANGTIDAKYLLGITAHDLTDGEDGYVISFGKIRQVNTDTFAAGAILYPSPTTAGVWTDVEPVAPNIDMPIGFCINSSVNNGTIAIRVASGYKLSELHDVSITSPVEKASLYYSGGLWRDTTAALLVSDTASMLTSYFKDSDTTTLNLTSRFAAKLNISDTASMLTNYLRTGVAASTYLTQSNAALTYLPLTGGTLTGILNGTNVSLNSNLTIADIIPNNPPSIFTSVTTGPSTSATVKFGLNQSLGSGGANMFMGGSQLVGGNGTNPNIFFTDSRRAYASIGGIYSGAGTSISGHIAFNTTPNDATTALTERMRIASDGAITMGGTLGVTGATTLSSPLTVNSSAVFNEGSTDSDFRVESDGNANMLFVDASTDRVGIGTNAPTKTLEVNGTINATGDITEGGLNVLTSADTASLSSRIDGKVSLTATETIGGTKTFNNLVNIGNQMTISGSVSGGNQLLGKNSSNNGVADITLGTGLSISSNVLNVAIPTERYYFDLGIVAGAADNSASTYDYSYVGNIFIVPTSLNGYCIDTVYIRAIGCSTCPPVSPDLDYYVGVYKANAGARVTTSGASLQGSQITMNEYDLNEVNTNYTLSTGEAWWVYLNGTYTSDMAYVTAGFIVKKTCN